MLYLCKLLIFVQYRVGRSLLFQSVKLRPSSITKIRIIYDTTKFNMLKFQIFLFRYKVGRSLLFQCWYYTSPLPFWYTTKIMNIFDTTK